MDTKTLAPIRLGIDVGGTKIEIVALDASGKIVYRHRLASPDNHYALYLQAICDLVKATETRLGVAKAPLGLGIPGAISPRSGRIKNANTTCLNGQALQQDLNARLGRSVAIENDANCFALSEASDGAGRDAGSVFGVILGTGVGGGLVYQGALVTGPNAIAGEWGHNPLPWQTAQDLPLQACYCGKQGCIETYLSGPGFAVQGRVQHGLDGDAKSLCEAAQTGEPAASAAWNNYLDRLARALASVINIVDPEVIVLGGGLSNQSSLYTEVPARWGNYVFSDSVETQLRPNLHGDSSGVRGAAWLSGR